MKPRFHTRWFGWGAPLWLLACATLPEMPSGVCGNGVVEGTEECDTFAPEGYRCRPPGVNGCRYECSPGGVSGPSCPSGSACGLDRVCRFSHPPRDYADWRLGMPQSVLPLPAESVRLGDFDGDSRQDLLALASPSPEDWRSLPRVLFLDDNGTPSDAFELEMPISSPAIARLEAGAAFPQEIVFGTAFGIGTLKADSERSMLPIAHPFQALRSGWSYRVLRVRGIATSPLHEGVLVFWSQGETTNIIAADQAYLGSLDRPLSRLVGEPIAANVIDTPDSPCDEVLLAFSGENQLRVLEVCDASGQWQMGDSQRAPVSLTGGHTIEQGVLIAHIDQDARLDVLLGDEQGRLYVAFGQDDGSFVGNPEQPESTVGQALPLVVTPGDCLGTATADSRCQFPLAAGDLNADGRTDWVTRDGILLADPVDFDAAPGQVTLGTSVAYQLEGTKWSTASVADLNRDGLLDLVAGYANEPGLEFVEGTGRDRLNPFLSRIHTAGPVSRMTIGDYNGDLVQDVAFGVQISPSGQLSDVTSEKLAISFGSVADGPGDAVEVAEFTEHTKLVQLATANYAGNDAIDELGVVALPGDGSGEELSVFIGSSGRHPIAPLGLNTIDASGLIETSGVPLGVAICRAAPSGDAGAVALALDAPGDAAKSWRLWYLPAAAQAESDEAAQAKFGDPIPSNPLPGNLVAWKDGAPSAHVFAGAVDVRQGYPKEAYLLTATSDATPTMALSRVQLPAQDQSWEGLDVVTLLSTSVGRIGANAAPQLVDLNGDGRRDLIMIAEDDTGVQKLWVVWYEPNNPVSFDLSRADRLDLEGKPVRGFAALEVSDATRLVAISDAQPYEFRTGAGVEPGGLTAAPIVGVPGGKAIALGDLTGDGLLDLVIAVSGGVRLYREVEAPVR